MAKNYKIQIPTSTDQTTGKVSYDLQNGTLADFCVDRNLNKSTTQNVLRMSFGDGYEQRAPNGINIHNETYNVSFMNRPYDEIQTIEDYLNDNAYNSFSFYVDEDTILVVCNNFNITYLYEEVYSLSAEFKRVYEP